MGFDEGVIGQRDSLLALNLSVAPFVDELSDRFEVRIAVCNVRLNDLEHLRGSLGETHEDTVVDLKETQKLKDLSGFRSDFVDTGLPPKHKPSRKPL